MMQHHIVPAQPGWFVATLCRAGSEGDESWDDHLSLNPIIAWEIMHAVTRKGTSDVYYSSLRGVTPILIDIEARFLSSKALIKRPDGRFVSVLYGGSFAHEAEAIKWMKEDTVPEAAA